MDFKACGGSWYTNIRRGDTQYRRDAAEATETICKVTKWCCSQSSVFVPVARRSHSGWEYMAVV